MRLPTVHPCGIRPTEPFSWKGDTKLQILKTFRGDYGRIRAVAERKVLAHPGPRVELTANDFARKALADGLGRDLTVSCVHETEQRRRSIA